MLGTAVRAPQRRSPPPSQTADAGGPAKVRAVLRVRPFLSHETATTGCRPILQLGEGDDQLAAKIVNPRNPTELLSYQFDRCYGPDAPQTHLFIQDVVPVVDRVLAGFNATIFAYGNTGAGKTHTMEGTIAAPGMIPLTVQYVLEALTGRRKGGHAALSTIVATSPPEVRLSYLEIYKEKVYDLLAANPAAADLPIREDSNHRILIPDLTVCRVRSLAEFDGLWARGVGNRRTAATRLNAHSSRSHSCLTIGVQSGAAGSWAKLHLIDLAGSEDNRRTANAGERLVESGAINRSLFVLGQVVDSLNSGAPRIPYRDSKLTRLLQDSLGGAAYALIIANVAPGDAFHLETCSTLNFASKSRQIENNVIKAAAQPPAAISNGQGRLLHGGGREGSGGGGGRSAGSDSSNTATSSPATISSEDVNVTKRRQRKRPLPADEENNPFAQSSASNGGASLQTLILERRIEEKVAQKLKEISKGTILSPLLKGESKDLLRLTRNLAAGVHAAGKSPLGKPGKRGGGRPSQKSAANDPLDPQVAQIMPMVEPEVLRIINYGTLREIKELKEIGSKRAQALLEHREAAGGEIKEMSELVRAGVLTNKVLGKIILANALGHVDFVLPTAAVPPPATTRHNPIILSEDFDHHFDDASPTK